MIYVLWLSFLFFIFRLAKTKGILLILPVFYCAVCIYSYYGIYEFNYAGQTPFYNIVDYESGINTVTCFLIATWSFYFGLICSFNTGNNDPLRYLHIKLTQIPDGLILFLYALLLVVFFAAWGVEHIIEREGYVLNHDRSILPRIMLSILLPVVSFLLVFLTNAYFKYILLFLLVVLVQSLNSRILLIIPVLFYIGEYMKDGHIKWFKVTFFAVLLVLLSALVLEYRNYNQQGLVPNIVRLYSYGLDSNYILKGVNYIISYSFFANLFAINELSIESKALYLSINPLPGRFIDIEYLINTLKLNIYAPYPALATLALTGNFVMTLYYFIAGLFWSFFYSYLSHRSWLGTIFIMVLFLLFTLLSLQYSLRTITRLFYYATFITTSFYVIKVLYSNYRRVGHIGERS